MNSRLAAPSPVLSASYQLTSADLKAARRLHAGSSLAKKVLGVIVLLCIGSSLLLGALSGEQFIFDLWPYFLGVGLWLALVKFFVWSNTRNAAKMRLFNAPSHTQLSEEGAANSYSATRMFWGWSDIIKVKTGPTHLLIYASAHSFVIVPRRAFESEAEFERFAEFARAQWQSAQPAVPPIAGLS